jgi:diguanylate cyclase (GGDEF)-like protein/PAS domain S-box-containing protein
MARRAQGEQRAGAVRPSQGDGTTSPADPTATPPHPLQSLPDAVVRVGRDWRVSYLNTAVEQVLGRPADDLLGQDLRAVFPLLGHDLVEQFEAVLATGQPRVFDYRHEPWNRWFEVRAYPDAWGLVSVVRDVDERLRAERERAAEVAQLTAVLDSLPAATVIVAHDDRITSVNRAWTANGELLRLGGVVPGGVGDGYLDCLSRGLDADDHAAIAAGLAQLRDGSGRDPVFDHEYTSRLGGETRWFRLQASRVGRGRDVVVSHVDVTDRVRSEQALAWQAAHDDLTGLPNRSRLLDVVGAALAARPRGGGGVALLLLDLDGFKMVNDSLGHDIGDLLLCLVAERLRAQLRPGDTVSRLGGDQFAVLAQGCDATEASAMAFRLQAAFALPFAAAGVSLPLTASIGVTVSRPDVVTAHDLLSDADAAMAVAKRSGRDRVNLFSPPQREAARWRLEVASRLREDAIDQLVVHYQPVVRLDTGAVDGVEALVRWQHPERGLLQPDSFLAVAEETGQVIAITRWLLCETTRKAAEWAAQGLPLRMAVNVSARHFSTETLVRDVRVALRQSGLPADQLVLELTETSVAEDPTRAEDQLSVLRGFGVRVAIDDFGTGWSSLSQLFSLPIGTLKIDRSLLAAAEHAVGGESGAVLAAIVELSRTLGIRSVAEGVETPEHLAMVRAAGCDLAQGWLLGYPMAADELPRWLRRVQAAGGDVCAQAVARHPVAAGP